MTATLKDYEASLPGDGPPPGLAPALAALWWAHRDGWDAAHRLVQDEPGPDAAWVHAWLHRVEGDPGNAAYWYRRADRPVEAGALDAEWRAIAAALLEAVPPR